MSAPGRTLIGNPVSPYVRKILAICALKGVDVAVDPVTPFRGDDAFAALSPLRRVPVWIEGDLDAPDFVLCDSSVIAEYLEETYPEPPLWPVDTRERARARWIEEYADTRLFDVLGARLFFQLAVRPRILKEETDQAVVDHALAVEVPATFDYLEGLMPADGFLFGSVGVADMALGAVWLNARMVGVAVDAALWPKLEGWIDRVERDTPLASLNALALALAGTPARDHAAVLAGHGYPPAAHSMDGGRAMRGPMSPR